MVARATASLSLRLPAAPIEQTLSFPYGGRNQEKSAGRGRGTGVGAGDYGQMKSCHQRLTSGAQYASQQRGGDQSPGAGNGAVEARGRAGMAGIDRAQHRIGQGR